MEQLDDENEMSYAYSLPGFSSSMNVMLWIAVFCCLIITPKFVELNPISSKQFVRIPMYAPILPFSFQFQLDDIDSSIFAVKLKMVVANPNGEQTKFAGNITVTKYMGVAETYKTTWEVDTVLKPVDTWHLFSDTALECDKLVVKFDLSPGINPETVVSMITENSTGRQLFLECSIRICFTLVLLLQIAILYCNIDKSDPDIIQVITVIFLFCGIIFWNNPLFVVARFITVPYVGIIDKVFRIIFVHVKMLYIAALFMNVDQQNFPKNMIFSVVVVAAALIPRLCFIQEMEPKRVAIWRLVETVTAFVVVIPAIWRGCISHDIAFPWIHVAFAALFNGPLICEKLIPINDDLSSFMHVMRAGFQNIYMVYMAIMHVKIDSIRSIEYLDDGNSGSDVGIEADKLSDEDY